MKKVFKSVSLLAIMMVIASSAMAWDHAYHVKQARNGKGDALIFPAYFAAPGGWETKLTVINTSSTYSTIAKIVFRSHYYSQEILDFMLYLTPADVWTGIIKHDGTNVYVYSEDDSVLTNASQFASKTSPLRVNMFPIVCPSVVTDERTAMSKGDSSDMGYVEVIETWYGNVDSSFFPTPVPNTLSTKRPVSKDYLRQLYSPTDGPLTAAQSGRITAQNVAATDPIISGKGVDLTANILTGYLEIRNTTVAGMGAGAMMQATVLADFDPVSFLNVSEASGINLASQTGRNSLGEVEAALSKENIALPYVNDPATGQMTVHLFNFPTKNSNFKDASGTLKDPITGECRYVNSRNVGTYLVPATTTYRAFQGTSPFWWDSSASSRTNVYYRCLSYSSTVYDLSENGSSGGIFSGGQGAQKWCEELDVVMTSGYSSLFTEGWTNYWGTYSNRTGGYTTTGTALPILVSMARNTSGSASLAYLGIPVIPSALMFKNGGIELVPGAYDDGEVYAIQNPLPSALFSIIKDTTSASYNYLAEYQYWNAMGELGINLSDVGYPAARTGTDCTLIDTYWDGTNNYPCIPVRVPRK